MVRTNTFQIHLCDKNGDKKLDMSEFANVTWRYNRIGGCSQADVQIAKGYKSDVDKIIKPADELQVLVNNEIRYSGKLVKKKRPVSSGQEQQILTFYGFIRELGEVIVAGTFEGQEVSEIVKSILDDNVVGVKKVTYDSADIETTDYSVSSITFNHSVTEAVKLLADLAGNVEWGVDRNKKFFFKQRDEKVRRVFILGRDVTQYTDELNFENVINKVRVHGADGLIVTIPSTQSINIFGENQTNIFESAITESSDANRLGAIFLKNFSNSQTIAKFSVLRPDEFIETSTPIGATTVRDSDMAILKKYGASTAAKLNKYGASTLVKDNKYGNLVNSQVNEIMYAIIGGGMNIEISLQGDVSNLGSQQKRVEFEIKNLQRK